MYKSIVLIGGLLLSLNVFAQNSTKKLNKMNVKQIEKKTENEIKSFVYAWYSRFDKGTSMEELKPFLPDDSVEFVYPTTTLNSVDELVKYAEQTFSYVKESTHIINEISVYKIDENNYEIICPHTYHALQADGNIVQMNFIGRMRLATNLKTKLDPSGNLKKVVAYKVVLQGTPTASTTENINSTKKGNFSFTDAKAFVHNWFANIDAGDADGLMELTSSSTLKINILGNEVKDKAGLKAFLIAQKESQNYSVHTPSNISVSKSDKEFQVTFVLNFEGEIKEMGKMTLSNITNWTLIEEKGQLKLSEYTLEIL
ncbi:hypothetical protein FUA26_01740 [Seonamhaeicola algicola]|uniref:Nuclear transport factor 2 family protein n=1 Tax=Seonamhaeicola algicola TaxID=1719036 RepID=A0A5C7AYS0_9FLAO|nr:hypothetical protein [Seonamhaeicola algicola]TXE13828.1 hypothetical protein FUA26_01740 [Seonamhaeicola algicola]